MQFKAIAAFALAAVVAASPVPGSGDNDCNGGDIYCCNQVQDTRSTTVNGIGGLLGIATGAISPQVGLSCSSVNVLAILTGSTDCSSQRVCCSGVQQFGLVNIACNNFKLL